MPRSSRRITLHRRHRSTPDGLNARRLVLARRYTSTFAFFSILLLLLLAPPPAQVVAAAPSSFSSSTPHVVVVVNGVAASGNQRNHQHPTTTNRANGTHLKPAASLPNIKKDYLNSTGTTQEQKRSILSPIHSTPSSASATSEAAAEAQNECVAIDSSIIEGTTNNHKKTRRKSSKKKKNNASFSNTEASIKSLSPPTRLVMDRRTKQQPQSAAMIQSRRKRIRTPSSVAAPAPRQKTTSTMLRIQHEWRDAIQAGIAFDWSTGRPWALQHHANHNTTAEISQPQHLWLGPKSRSEWWTWHFSFTGVPGSVYGRGVYHGRIRLPRTYPAQPPQIQLWTPNGRFVPYQNICLNGASHYHPESWQPSAVRLRSLIEGLRYHMLTTTGHEIGGITSTSWEERQRLAETSREFVVRHETHDGCGGIRVNHAEMLRQGWLVQPSSENTTHTVGSIAKEEAVQLDAAVQVKNSNDTAITIADDDINTGDRIVKTVRKMHNQHANEETKAKRKKGNQKHQPTSSLTSPSSRTVNGSLSSLVTATTKTSPSFILARVLQKNALWLVVGFCTLFAYLNILFP